MPSCEPHVLHAMGQHLLRAAQVQDWALLAQLDARVMQWAQALELGLLSAQQKSAWADLTVLHAEAMQACACARQEAAAHLQELNKQQEAQKAYAWQEVLG